MTRILVCGGRHYSNRDAVFAALDHYALNGPVTIIEGGAPGADSLARLWSWSRKQQCLTFPAQWSVHGKAAGPIRNQQMLDDGLPDLVLAFPGGRGTANMISLAQAAGVRVVELATCSDKKPTVDERRK